MTNLSRALTHSFKFFPFHFLSLSFVISPISSPFARRFPFRDRISVVGPHPGNPELTRTNLVRISCYIQLSGKTSRASER